MNLEQAGVNGSYICEMGNYSYSSLTLEDDYLLYTRDGEPYSYNINTNKDNYMAQKKVQVSWWVITIIYIFWYILNAGSYI